MSDGTKLKRIPIKTKRFSPVKEIPATNLKLGKLLLGFREGLYSRKYLNLLENYGFEKTILYETYIDEHTDMQVTEEYRYQVQRANFDKKLRSGIIGPVDVVFVSYNSRRVEIYIRPSKV